MTPSLLAQLIFGCDDCSLDPHKSFHARRLAAPQGDMPYQHISPEIATLIQTLDPEATYLYVHTHTNTELHCPYYTLWTPYAWRESAEKRYQLSKLSLLLRANYESQLAIRRSVTRQRDRLHDISVRFCHAAGKGFSLNNARSLIEAYWNNSSADEPKFRELILALEHALNKSIYLEPYAEENSTTETETTEPSNPTGSNLTEGLGGEEIETVVRETSQSSDAAGQADDPKAEDHSYSHDTSSEAEQGTQQETDPYSGEATTTP